MADIVLLKGSMKGERTLNLDSDTLASTPEDLCHVCNIHSDLLFPQK